MDACNKALLLLLLLLLIIIIIIIVIKFLLINPQKCKRNIFLFKMAAIATGRLL